ncbi:MAG TPA: hypothetical protein VN778_01540, partial [Verrucomicrobiae bacterium]|nr:hypothetical protein [Verrucomicrobiae bacterium]
RAVPFRPTPPVLWDVGVGYRTWHLWLEHFLPALGALIQRRLHDSLDRRRAGAQEAIPQTISPVRRPHRHVRPAYKEEKLRSTLCVLIIMII